MSSSIAGESARRDKKASKPLRHRDRHTPLSLLEPIPWDLPPADRSYGAEGALPIDGAVLAEAARRGVEGSSRSSLTDQACALLADADLATTNAILHVTC